MSEIVMSYLLIVTPEDTGANDSIISMLQGYYYYYTGLINRKITCSK